MNIPFADGPTVETRPVSPPYQHEDFSSPLKGLAQGFGEAGQAITGLQERLHRAKAEADLVATNDKLTAYQHDNTSALDGNSDPDADPGMPNAFLSTQGTKAAEESAPTLEWLSQRRKEYADSLTNDDQRKLFLKHSAPIYESSRARVETHTSRQRVVARDASVEARMASSLNATANNYSDDTAAEQQLKAVSQLLHATALSPEDGAAKVQAFQEKQAEVRLNRYLAPENKDWKGAETLYDRVKDVLGVHGQQIQKSIQQLKQDQVGEVTASKLIEEARSPENKRVDSAKALQLLDSVPPGPMRDEVRGRLANKVTAEEHAWNTRVHNVVSSLLTEYIKDGNSLDHVTSSAKSWLIENAGEEWIKLTNMARAEREQEARGTPPTPSQQDAYTRFSVDAADHPEKYATMSPAQFNAQVGTGLARQDRERAGQVLAHLHTQAAKPEKLAPIEDRMLLQMGREAGVFPQKENDVSKWGDDQQAQNYYRAQQAISEQVAQYRRQNGKEPPLDEVKKWATDMLLKGKEPGTGILGFFGTKTTRLESDVKGTPFEPTWSDADKTAARAALSSAGARVDDATIDTYLRRKHKLPSQPTSAKPRPKPVEPTPESPANVTDSRGPPGAPRFGESKL